MANRAPTLATVGAIGAGAVVAAACLVAPTTFLEAAVVGSGVAALVNAAAPPLGLTARVALAIGGGAAVAALVWAVLVLTLGERRVPATWTSANLRDRMRRVTGRHPAEPDLPDIRRADSHPDAPPRPPILAERDLGAPFLSIVAPAAADAAVAEHPLPADLDTALAAVDPAAIPAVPREPVRPVPSLATPAPVPVGAAVAPAASPPLAPGERIDTVELGAAVRDQPDSIESLLARLERGARRRSENGSIPPSKPEEPAVAAPPVGIPTASGSLEETLGSLRRLATRG